MGARTILIVEPNPGIMIVGRNVLARAGYDVHAVSTIDEALKDAKKRSFDCILLDGRHSEPEVLIALSRSKTAGVPIIITVQKGRDVLTVEALEAGGWSGLIEISEVIEKPFSPERLLQSVEKALSRSVERTDPSIIIDEHAMLLADEEGDERTEKFERLEAFDLTLYERPESRAAVIEHREARPRDTSSINPRFARLMAALKQGLNEQEIGFEPRQLLALARNCESALQGEDVFEQTWDTDGRGVLAMQGYLEHLSLDNVVQISASVAPPSRVVLEVKEQRIEIFFQGPNVVFARQSNMPEGFTLGRFLVASGVVDESSVDRSSQTRQGATTRIGQRLLALGLVGERDLKAALRRQTEELVYEAVRWTEGRFVLYANEPLPPEAVDAQVCLPIHHLLLEGMRRLDEYRRIAHEVGDMRSVIDRIERSDERAVIDQLRPDERSLLEQVDGHRTVEDLVRSLRRTSYDVVKSLHALRGHRLVTVIDPAIV
jgi:DNA-binding response OmpR family regulator